MCFFAGYLGGAIAMDDDRKCVIQHIPGPYPAVLKLQHHLIYIHMHATAKHTRKHVQQQAHTNKSTHTYTKKTHIHTYFILINNPKHKVNIKLKTAVIHFI